MPEVSELYIYPIKSLGGISIQTAGITDRGFRYDRRWMLVDSNNRFLTQREFPQMALLQVQLSDGEIIVQHKENTNESIRFPLSTHISTSFPVQIWSDECEAYAVDPSLDEWFSEMLAFSCRLVFMPDSSERKVNPAYAFDRELTSLSDGYPFLILGQSSLDDLNSRLSEPLPMNRFRPNIVFTGGKPFQEDRMEHFSINNVHFFGVKLCERCVITTINQDDASRSKEPLKTLSSYRQWDNKVHFGQNLLHKGEGEIHVGDAISIHQMKLQP